MSRSKNNNSAYNINMKDAFLNSINCQFGPLTATTCIDTRGMYAVCGTALLKQLIMTILQIKS